ncbi:MAG TPA: GNAT family N-acetyltransferase, partial [Candidatus Saccharimonadales bacterium]|nr:GNAT family N-acetyltransferase [Candidatus Saccharimonadales bacterium]
FTDELLVADGEMGGTFLNGHRIDLRTNPAVQEATFGEGMPYDFASWHGSLLDPRHLRRDLATEPNGTFAASGQIRDVLKLDSMSCVFTGTTIHDMLLGLAVELAGGVVTGLDGNPIDWDNPNGAVYSVNQNVHDGMIAALTADRLDGLAPGYEPVGKDDVTAEEILALRREAGFGTSWDEAALRSWRATLEKAEAFYGARERATGRLVLASLITGSPQVGFIHDILTAKDHRRFGLASRAVDKLVAYARNYVVDGEPVGMKDVYTDLGIRDLGRVPLEDCFKANQFEPDGENGYVWKLNLRKRNLTPAA